MPWTIERQHPHVAVVTMNTNKVNAQNPSARAMSGALFGSVGTTLVGGCTPRQMSIAL